MKKKRLIKTGKNKSNKTELKENVIPCQRLISLWQSQT